MNNSLIIYQSRLQGTILIEIGQEDTQSNTITLDALQLLKKLVNGLAIKESHIYRSLEVTNLGLMLYTLHNIIQVFCIAQTRLTETKSPTSKISNYTRFNEHV